MRNPANYYNRERRRGRTVSAMLHLVFFYFAIFGLPDFLTPTPPEEPAAITVEILPITGITNVKPSDTTPAEETKPEEKKPDNKKPSPPVKVSDDTPPPPPEPSPQEIAKEKAEALKKEELEKKKEEDKKKKDDDKKKKKKEEDDFNALLKSMKKTTPKENKDTKKNEDKKPTTDPSPNKAISNQYNPGLPMSLSEKDAIMSQIAKCWNPPIGAKDAQNLQVLLNAEYNNDGSLIKVELSNASRSRYNSDSFFRAAAESAIRAVKQCTPLTGLPQDKYNTWRQMELNFDPKYMLN